MYRWLLIGLCLCPLFLVRSTSITEQDVPEVTTTEGLPSNLVNQSVCVISGEYTDSVLDVVIPGPEPLVIQRHYNNKSKGNLGTTWSFNHGDQLIVGSSMDDQTRSVWRISLCQPSGAQLNYTHLKSKEALDKKCLQFQLSIPKGLTNGAARLSGRTNLKNQEVYFYPDHDKVVSISGAGNRRTFKKIGRTTEGWNICGQKSEEKVNGSVYRYESNTKNLMGFSRIVCQHGKTGQLYSEVKFSPFQKLGKQHATCKMSTSDGKHLTYYFKQHKFKIKEKTATTQDETSTTQYYLSKVEHPYAPVEKYLYEQKAVSKELQLVCKKRPDGRFIQTAYYQLGKNGLGKQVGIIEIDDEEDPRLDRVKKLQAPVGTDQTPITTHRFVYHCKVKKNRKDGTKKLFEGTTEVYDAYDHLTRYAYDASHRLSSVKRYEGTSSYTLYSKESYLWNSEGNLMGKIFKDGKKTVHHARYFTYDDHGNVLTSVLCGNLTGLSPPIILNSSHYPIKNGYESECKTYTYSKDGLNLVLTETDSNGKTIVYNYVKGTDQLQAKYVVYAGQVQLREFYLYDEQDTLIKKITDDGKGLSLEDLTGVTEWHYTLITPRKSAPFGLPEVLEEGYWDFATGQEKLLKSSHFHYSPEGRLLKQDVYDANREFAYTLMWDYDQHGNLILETNALGESISRKYDANDNLIFQQSSSSDFYIQNTYDFSNRLICQEEIHLDGQHLTTTHTYDYLGNCLATVNTYGQETRQTFDEFGRVLTIQYPAVLDEQGQLVHPQVSRVYNLIGYPICSTDAKGGQTWTEYNSRGQPTKITHPDGSNEQWIYRLDGQLLQKMDKNGSRTLFIRDPLGRITEESIYSSEGQLLKKTQHLYNALHLLQTIDAEGSVIAYTYDAAGRLEGVKQEERVQKNYYDSLGHLNESREWFGDQPQDYRATIKVYDALERVIEECLQDAQGNFLHVAYYAYNFAGHRTFTQIGDQKTWTEYDAHQQPIKITNALGHVTHTTYHPQFLNLQGQQVLQTITTDPLGYQIIHTYDTAQRLVEISRCHPFGSQLSHQIIRYDLCGYSSHLYEEVIHEGQVKRVIETIYAYSANHQVTALIEAAGTPEQKVTRTLYNSFGQQAAITKPTGTLLFYQYDALGRLKSLTSSDDSVSYVYAYNLRDQVTSVTDLHLNQITTRHYDAVGQMIQETLGNGLALHYAYDKIGRACSVLLPDQTGVEYIYNAVDLKEIHRVIAGKRVYTHQDEMHTLSGQVANAQLPGNNGNIKYKYNPLGHCIEIQSTHFQQTIPDSGFDAAGNLLCFQSQGVPHTFTYDDYYHLKSETGHRSHSYEVDSLSNRVKKDGEEHSHNALNQVLKKGNEQFIYDANGNLIQWCQGEKVIYYAYDALDRLRRVSQEEKVTAYVYDAFNRRLSKKQEGQEEQLFVYQGQEEIGKWLTGGFQELRLLGKNPRCPMVALEIKEVAYVPVHDFSGNVTCLLDHDGQVIERYCYTAFGEVDILSPEGEKRELSTVGNPWQYASKRLDEESGLVAFGLRYYAPELGRWITADPAGFADGSNLYAYVQNSPLLHFDQFGLYTNVLLGSWGGAILNATYQGISCLYHFIQSFYHSLFGESDITVKHLEIEDGLAAKHNFRAKPSSAPFERTATYSLNNNPDFLNPVTGAPFQLKEDPDIGTGFHHGIGNTFQDFKKSMIYLGQFSEYNIQGVYSPSYGFMKDAECYLKSIRHYVAYEAVREIHKMWYDFFEHSSANATFLMYCHSRGVVYVRNALRDFPEELRQRIEVIAIAPGGYIDPYLCKSINHYESNGDFIPLFDMAGRKRCQDTIITLERHPQANYFFDHSFNSKTYEEPLQKTMREYHNK